MRHPCALFFLLLSAPAVAQTSGGAVQPVTNEYDGGWQVAPAAPAPSEARQTVGRTAESSAGRVGERQRRDQADGIEPLARIEGRLTNRVQSRIRNRIDRNYDPLANATSPFMVAGDAQPQARGQIRRK